MAEIYVTIYNPRKKILVIHLETLPISSYLEAQRLPEAELSSVFGHTKGRIKAV